MAEVVEFTSRSDWLDKRRQGIGASDVAAIVGMSKWRSSMAIWLDKNGMLPPDDGTSEWMQWGQLLEPVILDRFETETGMRAVNRGVLYRCTDHPTHLATVDAEAVSDDGHQGLVEVKTTSDWSWDDIPDHYLLQGQWQLHVTGHSQVWFAVLHGGRRFRLYGPIVRDDELIGQLTGTVDWWWQTYMIPNVMPPVDSSPATHDVLKDAYRLRASDRVAVLDPSLLDVVEEIEGLKARRKELEAEISAHESLLFAALGDATVGTVDGVPVVTWRQVEVPERVVKASVFRRLNLPKRKDLE